MTTIASQISSPRGSNLKTSNSLTSRKLSKKRGRQIPLELPIVRQIPCNLCGNEEFNLIFTIESAHQEQFQLVSCHHCQLAQINPQPNAATVKPYYNENYFLKRTKRGYENYYSEAMKHELRRVYLKNLDDLDFFTYEKLIKKTLCRALDVGCAAGYFVELLKERGWQAEGIELSDAPAREGRKRGLKIHTADFLSPIRLKPKHYHLVTFWASIEHMHDPFAIFSQCARILKPGGRFLLSTCNYEFLAKIQKSKWRFMNVPEHLYFFNMKQLVKMAQKAGFSLVTSVHYGSGLTQKKEMGHLYGYAKKMCDYLAKRFKQGDMMALHFQKSGKSKK